MEQHNTQADNIVFQEERLQTIAEKLEREGRIVTKDLVDELNTTPVTLRKDLLLLEKRGLLKRTHGGAVKVNRLYPGQALNEKEKINLEEKIRIVRKAATFVAEGDTIILDSGSTTSLLAKELRNFKRLVVITNALNIASDLSDTSVEVIVVGGNLLKMAATMVGPLADDTLRKVSADKLFMGVDGVDMNIGLTTPDINEAKTSRVMMESAGEVFLLVDASKFGRRSLGVISPLSGIDKLITTKHLSEEEFQQLSKNEIDIFMV
jgi:glucitol operon repressor